VAQGNVAGYCVYGNEPAASIRGGTGIAQRYSDRLRAG